MVQKVQQSKHHNHGSRLRPRPKPLNSGAVVGAGGGGQGASSRTATAGSVVDIVDDEEMLHLILPATKTMKDKGIKDKGKTKTKTKSMNRLLTMILARQQRQQRPCCRGERVSSGSRVLFFVVVAFLILTASFFVGYVYVTPSILQRIPYTPSSTAITAPATTTTTTTDVVRLNHNNGIRSGSQNSQQQQPQQRDDDEDFALLPPFPKVWRPINVQQDGNNSHRHVHRHDGSDHAKTVDTTSVTTPAVIPLHLSDEILQMCTETLWHTVETTTIVLPDGDTFVHTGDIDDLWVRDSAAQLHTLLVPTFGLQKTQSLASLDPQLRRVVSGLIRRVAMYIRHDPYANAFRIDDSYKFSEQQKKLGRHDLISTWNYELDSGCYYIRMVWYYWKFAGAGGGGGGREPHGNDDDASVLQLQSVKDAVCIMVELWIAEQRHEQDEYPTGPLFDCLNCNKPYNYPGLKRNGKGSKTNPHSGLTWTGFRPSDDECQYHYLIPANMFCVVVLGYVIEMASPEAGLWNDPDLVKKATSLRNDIQDGIQKYGVVDHPTYGKIYAYEVDGYGNYNLMDDANVPSLLSIPYIGYESDHQDGQIIYENTRRFILSDDNPTYHEATNRLTGTVIKGYGSPHVGIGAIRNNIWPMSIAMQGLTSSSLTEKLEIINLLVEVSAGTNWMHESFDPTNPHKYTRSWFCWADSLFAELVTSVVQTSSPRIDPNQQKQVCPLPSKKYSVMEWRDPIYIEGNPRYALN